jgi:Glycosyl transferase family 2
MRVVMTLLVKDEADIIDAQIAFHLAAGVDFVVATDHESRDDTVAILERYAADGVLHLLRESGGVLRQSQWVTRMARLATTEFGADWVINSDADEFWWPSGGSLKQVLSHVPPDYGIVRSFVRPFLPPLEDGPFAERMIMRLSPPAAINDPSSPFRANVRLLHRGVADVVVGTGNASVSSRSLTRLPGWSPVEVLHFPIRGFSHFERKFLAHYETVREPRRGDHRRAWEAAQAGRLQELYGHIAANPLHLQAGLEDGSVTVDTRLRDALRLLSVRPVPALEFPPRDAREEAGCAVERAVLDESELVRLHRFADRLAQRSRGVRAGPSVSRRRPRPRPAVVRPAEAVGRRSPPAPKLVMTLVVRDEEDILGEHLEYHLNAGVDLVIVTDHRSRDGTSDILASYAREGVVVMLREEAEYAQQAAWQTHMARLASSEHAADWVINGDADEFWWPRGSSLKETLHAIPSSYGVVYGLQHNFIPPRDDDGWFIDRMTARLALAAPINDPATPFRLVVKVAHRGNPRVEIQKGGGHQVFGLGDGVLRTWYPLDVLHFPFRSRTQSMDKYRKAWTGWEHNLRADLARARQASDEGRHGAMWDRIALDNVAVQRGLREGWLVLDVRLRDAFERLRRARGDPAGRTHQAELSCDMSESAVFEEADVIRLQRWTDEIHRRVNSLEDGL